MSAGVLLLTLLLQGLKQPDLSPDAKAIAFSWHGDIWVVSLDGGEARRVTKDPSDETAPAWSPDGGRLAFSTDDRGNLDIVILDLETGTRTPLTVHEAEDAHPSWSVDGGWIEFESNREPLVDLPTNRRWFDVWKVRAAGGTPQRVTRFGGRSPHRGAYDRYATGYGDGEHDIHLAESAPLVKGTEDARHPCVEGGWVYYSLRPRNGIAQIWRARTDGGPREQLTRETSHARWPTVRADTVVFESGYALHRLGDGKIPITFPENAYVDEEGREQTFRAGLRAAAWSPDGRRVVGVLMGDLYEVTIADSKVRRLTSTLEEERDVSWTADGRVLFVRGHYGGFGRVCVLDGTEVRVLMEEEGDYLSPRLSGNRLAWHTREAGRDVVLRDLSTGASLRFDELGVEESHPVFSEDGGRMAYLRHDPSEGRTEIVRVDVDGSDALVLYEESGECRDLAWSPNGLRLSYCRLTDTGYATARVLNLRSRILRRIPRPPGISVRRPSWAPDSSRLVVEERPVIRGVEDAEAARLALQEIGEHARVRRIDYVASRRISRRDEMLEVFYQVWGLYQQSFYDSQFHGADWDAIRERFQPLAAEARTKGELYALLGDMLRELNASHVRHRSPEDRSRVRTGLIGADLIETAEGLRVVRTARGGPADWAGIEPGDVIVKDPGSNLNRRLEAAPGLPFRLVEMRVRRSGGERRLRIQPVSMKVMRELRYRNLISERKEKVERLGGGRLGYHHIQFMHESEVRRFATALRDELAGREGLILDIRDGVGGLAHWQMLALLDGSIPERFEKNGLMRMRYRDGRELEDLSGPNSIGGPLPTGEGWRKPIVIVQNEVSRSDKEIFSWMLGALGLGYRVGTPTAGGVIGGYPVRLVDGSSIILSVQGWRTPDGRNMEGVRVVPDHVVALGVPERVAGRDPQLALAIELLLQQLEGKVEAPEPK